MNVLRSEQTLHLGKGNPGLLRIPSGSTVALMGKNDEQTLRNKDPAELQTRRRTLRSRIALLFLIAVPTFFLLALTSGFVSTQSRMAEFRTKLTPGTSLSDMRNLFGEPDIIVRRGEPLRRARRSYTVPPLDEHTALYFYPRSGMPYYNVYVYFDERDNRVIHTHIENLWW